jgi:hypothetical protein
VTQSGQTNAVPQFIAYPAVPGWLAAPAIGGDYFLAERLSLGGEVQVRVVSWSADRAAAAGSSIVQTTSGKSIGTHGLLVLRVYVH